MLQKKSSTKYQQYAAGILRKFYARSEPTKLSWSQKRRKDEKTERQIDRQTGRQKTERQKRERQKTGRQKTERQKNEKMKRQKDKMKKLLPKKRQKDKGEWGQVILTFDLFSR